MFIWFGFMYKMFRGDDVLYCKLKYWCMNLFFNGQDAINLKSVSQINLDTSFQCPAF